MSAIDTKQIKEAALKVVTIIADAIREAGEIPSGHLYAMLMPFGINLHLYQQIIDGLQKAGRVKKTGDLLTWVKERR